MRLERDFPGYTIDLGLVPFILGFLDARHRFINAKPSRRLVTTCLT
jgi:hypothetical protein